MKLIVRAWSSSSEGNGKEVPAGGSDDIADETEQLSLVEEDKIHT